MACGSGSDLFVPKGDCTLSQHDGVCFSYRNFSPHKPIPSDAFMPEEILDFHLVILR